MNTFHIKIFTHNNTWLKLNHLSRLETTKIEFWRIKWSTLEWRPLCIPSLFESLVLFFLLSCGKSLHFSLLFIHYLSDSTLSLIIKFIKFFRVVHFGSINLGISHKNSVPYFLFCLLKVKIEIILPLDGLNLPHRFWCINFFVQLTLNDNIGIFVLHRNMLGFDFDF